MPKFKLTITVESSNKEEAQKVGQVLQNFSSNTTEAQKKEIHSKIIKNPKFFKKIAKYLKYA